MPISYVSSHDSLFPSKYLPSIRNYLEDKENTGLLRLLCVYDNTRPNGIIFQGSLTIAVSGNTGALQSVVIPELDRIVRTPSLLIAEYFPIDSIPDECHAVTPLSILHSLARAQPRIRTAEKFLDWERIVVRFWINQL